VGVKKLHSELEGGLMAALIHVTGGSLRPVPQASVFWANVAVFLALAHGHDPDLYVRHTSLCTPSAAWTQHVIDDLASPFQMGFLGSFSSCCLRQIACAQVSTAVASG